MQVFRLLQWWTSGLFFWIVVLHQWVIGAWCFKLACCPHLVENVHQPMKIRTKGHQYAPFTQWCSTTHKHRDHKSQNTLDRMMSGPLLGTEFWFLGHPAHSPVTTTWVLQLLKICLWNSTFNSKHLRNPLLYLECFNQSPSIAWFTAV